MTSSRFWRSFPPYFGQERYESLATTVRTFFDENISNQFYVRISVVKIPQVYLFVTFILLLYKCVYYVVRPKLFYFDLE